MAGARSPGAERASASFCLAVRVGYAVPLALLCWSSAQRLLAVPGTAVSATGSDAGAWVVVGTGAALEIFDCAGLLCGRIVWLRKARNTAGRPVQDDENPNPTIHGLRPGGRDHWNSGPLYNPDDGQTYRVSAKLCSPDVLVVRIYDGVPLFGETKTSVEPGARLGRALLVV